VSSSFKEVVRGILLILLPLKLGSDGGLGALIGNRNLNIEAGMGNSVNGSYTEDGLELRTLNDSLVNGHAGTKDFVGDGSLEVLSEALGKSDGQMCLGSRTKIARNVGDILSQLLGANQINKGGGFLSGLQLLQDAERRDSMDGILQGAEASVLLILMRKDERSPFRRVDEVGTDIRTKNDAIIVGTDDGQSGFIELEVKLIAHFEVLGQISLNAGNHILNPSTLELAQVFKSLEGKSSRLKVSSFANTTGKEMSLGIVE